MTNSPWAFAGHGTQSAVQPVPGQGFQRVSLCLRNRPNRSEKRVLCLNPSQSLCPRIDFFPLIPYPDTNSYIFTICFCWPRFMPRRSTGDVNAVSQNCRPFSIYGSDWFAGVKWWWVCYQMQWCSSKHTATSKSIEAICYMPFVLGKLFLLSKHSLPSF